MWPYAAPFRARADIRRLLHARPRARGRRPAARLLPRLLGLRRHVARDDGAARPASTGERSPSTCRGSARRRQLKPGKVLPQLDRFAEAVVRYAAPDGGAVVVGNSLGGCVALRLAEQDRARRSPASCPSRRPGSTWRAGWRSSSATRSCAGCCRSPVPLPESGTARERSPRSTAGSRSTGRGSIDGEGDRRLHQPLRRAAHGRALLRDGPLAPARS